MIPSDSSESYWWTRLSNFQNQSLKYYWIKLIPHMIQKKFSTSHWFWIDYKYGKSLILSVNGPSEICHRWDHCRCVSHVHIRCDDPRFWFIFAWFLLNIKARGLIVQQFLLTALPKWLRTRHIDLATANPIFSPM